MFKWYGFLGILMIIFAEFTMFLRIQPFATWFLPIVWFGYIFLVDSTVFMLKGNSLINNRPKRFITLLCVSVIFWYIFEIYNQFIHGWHYAGLPESRAITFAMGSISFATIVPAVFETWELIRQFHLFNSRMIRIKFKISKYLLYASILTGLIFLILPFFYSKPFMWVFVWTGFVLLLDPIMFLLHNEKSLLWQVKKRKFNTVFSLFLAGYICGFLWEFWNYWQLTKWYYTVPILENIKIFEIPVVGFLAYGPFAWELYIMYHFVKLLFSKKFLGGVAGI